MKYNVMRLYVKMISRKYSINKKRLKFNQSHPHEFNLGYYTFTIEDGELKYSGPIDTDKFIQPNTFTRVRTIPRNNNVSSRISLY